MADDETSVERWGSVERQVRADVAALGTITHRTGDALAELAYALGRRMDNPEEKSPAQVSKELRLTLAELAQGAPVEDDLEDELSTPT